MTFCHLQFYFITMIKNKTHKSVSNVSETFHYYKSIRNAVSTERNNPNFIYNDNGIYGKLNVECFFHCFLND